MSLRHNVLACAYPLLRLGRFLSTAIARRSAYPVRVLLYHDIGPREVEKFRKQIIWLSKSWDFISPAAFERVLSGTERLARPSLLLTFDDGFSSNRFVAERILNPMGIKAIFFVISEFFQMNNPEQARTFISKNILPESNSQSLPGHLSNMTLTDLQYLIETGHQIGSHTATHARLSEITDNKSLEKEIIESADALCRTLGIPIEHFAYTFGNLESFSPMALHLARSRFKFVHTGLRGDNAKARNPWGIRRDAIQPHDSFFLVGSLLEGGADRMYTRAWHEYEHWGLPRK